MKKFIFTAAGVMASLAAFAQGTVNFNNRVPGVVDARVTWSYGGLAGPGLGAGFTAQLFGGPVGGSLTALIPTTTFRTSTAAAMGYVNAVVVEVPGVAPSSKAILQMKVFDGDREIAASTPITIALGGGLLPPSNLEGLQPFAVIIPEPSTIALAIVGGAALLFLRRRKR